MKSIRLLKREKEDIRQNAKEYEREMLLELLTDSDDENIIALVDEVLVTVKMIHGEEIMEHVNVRIERDEQALIHQKQMIKDRRDEMEKMHDIQGYFGKYGQRGISAWDQYSDNSKQIWKDPNGDLWYTKPSSYGMDPASSIWKTTNSAVSSGASSTGSIDGSSAGSSNMSIAKLAEQIQIMNDLKIHHASIEDYIGNLKVEYLTTNTKKKKKKKKK